MRKGFKLLSCPTLAAHGRGLPVMAAFVNEGFPNKVLDWRRRRVSMASALRGRGTGGLRKASTTSSGAPVHRPSCPGTLCPVGLDLSFSPAAGLDSWSSGPVP